METLQVTGRRLGPRMAEMAGSGMMGDVCSKKSHEKDVFLKMFQTCLDNY